MSAVRLYRHQVPDLPRTGKLILEVGEQWYDLTEHLWKREMPLVVTALCRRELFRPDKLEVWLEQAHLPEAEPIEKGDALLPPLLPAEVGKILALGKNFRAHAAEFDEQVPEEPLYFNKLPETLCGHGSTVSPPRGYRERLDHEVELAVIVGSEAKRISEESAMDVVAGYSVANDLTLRTIQGQDKAKNFPWFRAKNFDGSCPLGPCFVPVEHLDIGALRVTAEVNGELRQDGNLSDLVVSVPRAISYLSHHLTLHPGDIVLMGTPAGVGPLENGDVVTCRIEGIGELTTVIERE